MCILCWFESNVVMYTIHTFSQTVWVNFGVVKDNKNVVYVSGVIYYVLRFEEMFKVYIK